MGAIICHMIGPLVGYNHLVRLEAVMSRQNRWPSTLLVRPSSQNTPLMKRQGGRRDLQGWGCFSAEGKSDICVVWGNINAKQYTYIIDWYLLPFVWKHHPRRENFQQYKAIPHNAELKMKWMKAERVELLFWPMCSPDMNQIEILWRILALAVYKNSRTFMMYMRL